MTKYEIPIESKKKKSARIPIDKLRVIPKKMYIMQS